VLRLVFPVGAWGGGSSAAAVVVALLIGCAPPVRTIAPSPTAVSHEKTGCQAPDVVDGEAALPVAIGDVVEGDAGDGQRFSFCATPGTWVRFKITTHTGRQPALRVQRGSVAIAENRAWVFEPDRASELLVDDGVYAFTVEPLTDMLATPYTLTIERPGAGVVVADADRVDAGFGNQVWGRFGDAPLEIALPPVDHDALLEVAPAFGGFFGNGATVAPVIDVVADGTVVASLDFTDKRILRVPVSTTRALSLRVAAAGSLGERPFFALEQVALSARPANVEHDDAHNGVVEGAEPLELVDGSAEVLVDLANGDVDFFSFTTATGLAKFSCAAESVGSGARELEVDVRDATGALLERSFEADAPHEYLGGTKTFIDAAVAAGDVDPGSVVYGEVKAGSFADGGRYALCKAETR
jgi:hypothetical protein